MPYRLDARAAGFERDFAAFLAARRAGAADVARAVADIVADVRARGDAALVDLAERFDGHRPAPAELRVAPSEIAAAHEHCADATLEALELARARIEAFHENERPAGFDVSDEHGIRTGVRWRPVAAAGLYVPGGTAAYPSSVLMGAVPARVAGVERLVMTVPAPGGEVSPLTLAAVAVAGVDEVYRVGGAQAIAALAYGSEAVAPVDMIVGPGNAYVAEAKRQVFGDVGIDMLAGPSEILVVADAGNDPAAIAADLLAQSEHDAAAQAILMTDDADFAAAVERALAAQLEDLPRRAIAGESWQRHGAVVLLGGLAEAPALVDRVAPEHLALAVAEPDGLAAQVRHAGAIFLGRDTPEAIGDYVGGPNHVLPTDRSARFASGLSVADFMKRSTLLACPPAGLRAIGPAAVTLAEAEGLDAHALSVALRLRRGGG